MMNLCKQSSVFAVLLFLALSNSPIEAEGIKVCRRTNTPALTETTTTAGPETTTTVPPTTTTMGPTTTPVCAASACDGYITFTGNHVLKINTERFNFDDAKACCEAQGARLAVITDSSMNEAVKEALPGMGMEAFWIGLEYQGADHWRWLDLTDLNMTPAGADTNGDFVNWDMFTPGDAWDGDYSDQEAHCAGVFDSDTEPKWIDQKCDMELMSVCECMD